MQAVLVLICLALAGVVTGADQVPLGRTHDDTYITRPLNFSSPAPHLFASAYGLLQQWSNTVFPNGHSLVAATIPAYTLLHHGLQRAEDGDDDSELSPASPEWLALDAAMAYGIMGGVRGSWLLTYQTTRRVRVLYVDGMSAALMGLGQLDTQMLLLYGNATGPAQTHWNGLAPEYDRARGLCGWLAAAGLGGRGWGFEGVVRMNAGFELIWCDFQSDSLRLVSRLDVTVRGVGGESKEDDSIRAMDDDDDTRPPPPPLPPIPTRTDTVADPSNPPAPPNWRRPDDPDSNDPDPDPDPEPFVDAQGWAWFESATWHYGASRAGPGAGEARIRVDPPCAVLSYYARRFDAGPLAHGRAVAEQARLNLTAGGGGAWAGAKDKDRDSALRQLARRRRLHHLGDAGVDEAAQMRSRAEAVLRRVVAGDNNGTAAAAVDDDDRPLCSGAEWPQILATIVQQTARHLKTLEALLQKGPNDDDEAGDSSSSSREWLRQLRSLSHMFLVDYVAYPAASPASSSSSSPWRRGSALFNRTLARCRYRYTRLLTTDDDQAAPRLSEEETDLRWAVEETHGALCEGLLGIGFDVERAWAGSSSTAALLTHRTLWLDQLTELIAWLGWEPEFLGCAEVCAWHERCFIPMWPLMGRRLGRGRPHSGGHGGRGGGRDGDAYGPYGPPDGPRYGPPPGHGNRSFPGFPRSPAMMGDETDLWEPKCVEAWYVGDSV